jgi:acylphosphatase
VQGVNFRAWTRQTADRLGLSGWVRNLPDGNVEAVFSGPAPAVAAILAACREGPRHAKVQAVQELGAAEPATGPFLIRP